MNINVSLPTIIPNQLQPQTESARTDNRRAALIPQSRQSEAFNAESEVGSQKEKSRASQANPNQTSQQARDGGEEDGAQPDADQPQWQLVQPVGGIDVRHGARRQEACGERG